AIAYRELAPGPRAEVVRLLRLHPHPVQRESAPPGLDDATLLMDAARRPDDIRGDPAWDHPAWHYINVPLTRDGVSGSPPAAPNILTGLQRGRRGAPSFCSRERTDHVLSTRDDWRA